MAPLGRRRRQGTADRRRSRRLHAARRQCLDGGRDARGLGHGGPRIAGPQGPERLVAFAADRVAVYRPTRPVFMTARNPTTFVAGAGPVATALAGALRLSGVPVLGLWGRTP